jgi:outer membrane immunogenic protein
MRLLRVVMLAGVVVAAPVSLGSAQSAMDWTGPYAGVTVGGAFGRSTITTVVDCNVWGVLCDPAPHYPENGVLIGETASGAAQGSAFTAGIFVGRNWQVGSIVYGVEADASAMPLNVTVGGSGTTLNLGLYNEGTTEGVFDVPSVFTVSATASADWVATARARAGVLVAPGVLLYGTAGVALTTLTVSNSFADNFNNGVGTGNRESSSTSALRAALIVGAGAEWAMSDAWTLRLEALHTNFGSLSTTGISSYVPEWPDSNPITSTADLRTAIVRVGMAYGF